MESDAKSDGKRMSGRVGCLAFTVVLLVLFLGLGMIFIWFGLRSLSQDSVTVTRGSVVDVAIGGSYSEGPSALDLGPIFGAAASRSVWDLRRGILAAADDPDIAGMRLRISPVSFGWATADELLAALDRFRAAGKPIHALLETDMVGDLEYFLATAADRVWMTPEGMGAINGLVAEVQFYRGSLEKAHIEAEVVMYKEYKSAGEPWVNDRMSPFMREATGAVMETIDTRFVERVVERRGIEPAALRELMSEGLSTPGRLLSSGLVDDLGYRDELETAMSEELGVESFATIALPRYLRGLEAAWEGRGDRIAVIFGEGTILPHAPPAFFPFGAGSILGGAEVASHFEEAVADRRVRAILFRVNSPGGSVVGSDLVRRAVEKARAAGKPVVVSMSDLAGSGGYWVAMEADSIVAHSTTQTGSIGVVFRKLNLDGLFEWLGTRTERLETSPSADIFSTGPLAAEQRATVIAWIDQSYGSFVERVGAARGLTPEATENVARGRVWSGRDALANGLVDRLGGVDEATEVVAELLGEEVGALPLVVMPAPRSLWQELFSDADVSLLGVGSPPIPAPGSVVAWMHEMAAPRVQALMSVLSAR